MGIIDLLLIAVILISGLLAFYRGLIRELLGLIAWVLAAFGAFYGLSVARPLFRKMITNPTVADIVAAIVIALIILVICTIINAKINEKLRKSVLSGLDRILGLAFGILRGLLLIIVVYYFAVFALKKETIEECTDKNFSLAYLEKTMPVVENILPDDIINGIQSMSNKQQVTAENIEIKEKPVTPDAENQETVSYDKKDLDDMDILLESIEGE
ncbi:MAG: CvpA family protein [Alphaproteobacteria bacterium]|nr:CvpA family protein [Alphaproteobacteria bacterium]